MSNNDQTEIKLQIVKIITGKKIYFPIKKS